MTGAADPSRRRGLPLGRVAGAPIRLSPSWILIALFIAALFGPQVERVLPGPAWTAWAVALAYTVLLALSVLLHEIAHALVGRALGQRPEEIVLTLWGGHTQFRGPHATPGASVATALAGPAANLLLAAAAWTLGAGLDARGVTGLLLDVTVWANLLLAGFNVLPGAPLDGGRMVESAAWAATGSRDRGTEASGWAGRAIAVALVVLWIGLPLLRGGRPGVMSSLLVVWIAVTLWQGASASVERGRWGRRMSGVRLRALEIPAVAVPLGVTVAQATAGLGAGTAVVAVDASGRPRGVLDLAAVGAMTPTGAATTAVEAACRRVPEGAVLDADALPAGGAELVAALTRPDAPGVAGPDQTPVWVLVDRRGGVRSVLPRETILTALAPARAADPEEPRP